MSSGREPSAVSRQPLYPDSRPWTRWWWFNSVLRDEDIRAQLFSTAKPGEASAPVVLSLQVPDANGLSRTATVTVNVGQSLWLPIIVRD